MYIVINDDGLEVARHEDQHKAFGLAQEAVYGKVRVFSKYVEPNYLRKPYEGKFMVSNGNEEKWVAATPLEHEIVFVVGGIIALVDGGLTDVATAQKSLEILKEDTLRWSSIGKDGLRKIIQAHFRGYSVEVKLVNDRLTIVPKTSFTAT
jgi:hypothetical protein